MKIYEEFNDIRHFKSIKKKQRVDVIGRGPEDQIKEGLIKEDSYTFIVSFKEAVKQLIKELRILRLSP